MKAKRVVQIQNLSPRQRNFVASDLARDHSSFTVQLSNESELNLYLRTFPSAIYIIQYALRRPVFEGQLASNGEIIRSFAPMNHRPT